ncbi:uncharacterized protein LOC116846248 isoform X2 [Odontomachus brunneus]|uniref:uncharacterized protein LOC116846248 isoform X2 n=1 Tax=Odontomachus brunneus TaxID=486640 RepID=UPI0013F1C3E5|nr:uncharacterized protein LOC116846248 isoform X2 [Odontomachus brunneus]
MFTRTNNKTTKLDVLNINDELETIMFATDEMLESQVLEYSTVKIIGFIDEIEGPKIVGKVQQYKMLKFILNNNSRHRIQVVAWNKEVDKVEHLMTPNNVNKI